MPAPLGNQYALGNEGGRPTEFNEQYISDAYEYVDSCKDENEAWVRSESVTETAKKNSSSKSLERIKLVRLPSHEGFAIYLTQKHERKKFISPTTLYVWGEKHEEFQKALDYIKLVQKQRLIDKGLAGEYNSNIAKLVLGANHDMVERQKIEQTNRSVEDVLKEYDQ